MRQSHFLEQHDDHVELLLGIGERVAKAKKLLILKEVPKRNLKQFYARSCEHQGRWRVLKPREDG